jgi:hypothetical protein
MKQLPIKKARGVFCDPLSIHKSSLKQNYHLKHHALGFVPQSNMLLMFSIYDFWYL